MFLFLFTFSCLSFSLRFSPWSLLFLSLHVPGIGYLVHSNKSILNIVNFNCKNFNWNNVLTYLHLMCIYDVTPCQNYQSHIAMMRTKVLQKGLSKYPFQLFIDGHMLPKVLLEEYVDLPFIGAQKGYIIYTESPLIFPSKQTTFGF